MKTIEIEPTFESWQAAARVLLREDVPPAEVRWREGSTVGQASLPGHAPAPGAVKVPREFLDLARRAAAAPDPARWQILYDTLWRLTHEKRDLLRDTGDPGVRRLRALLTQKVEEPEPDAAGAGPFVPAGASLRELSAAASRCKGCDLYRHATQTVFGRGSAEARIVFVGEQPGDQEDRQGAPFVGPRWPRRASSASGSMSPTPSSTSNSSRAASAGSTRPRGRPSSRPAARGSKPSWS
jgi:hypothetical protein